MPSAPQENSYLQSIPEATQIPNIFCRGRDKKCWGRDVRSVPHVVADHSAVDTAITPTRRDDRMMLDVPLVNGCAMVRIVADEAANAAVVNPAPELGVSPGESRNPE